MPKFRYQAVDDYGNLQKGVLEAQTFQMAVEDLKGKGLWIMDMFDQSKSLLYRDIQFGGPKVRLDHFTAFCRQLATLYKSGVSMVESIQVLGEQAESKAFRKILQEIAGEMQKGTQFSVAISRYPTVFNTIFLNMIRAGESSGNLDEMLNRLAVFHEKERLTKEKVKSAMIYPIIMSVVSIIVITLMMMFVIPKFVTNFQQMGIELPLPTRIVIHASNFVKSYWYLIVIGLLLPGAVTGILKRSAKGSLLLDYIKLKIPVFGKLWHKQAMARFSRTFASLFAAAVPMLQMMSIVSAVVGNEVISKVIKQSREGLKNGQSITGPLKASWLFPPMVVQMIAIGEATGALDSMLEKVADFYEADVEIMSDRLKALLEPLMILFLAVIVGCIVAAVMLPTYKMLENYH